MARMNLAIADDLLAALETAVPARQRSAFVTEAVREKLERLQQMRAAAASAGAWSDEGRDDPETELRRLRAAWTERTDG